MKESIKKKFDSIDKSKIKVESTKELLAKIEKALNSKTQENVDKAEALLDKFISQAKAKKADIFVSKKAEPTLTPTEKKKATQVVKSKLETLMDTIANDPLLKDFNNARRSKGGGKSDPLIDSERKAIQSGVRVSKKGWKNQYGKSQGGRKYYEYRENRIDRKAPNYGDRPWLKEGGFIHPSDANADKYVVVEIKEDGSRREHNNFGDLETARMFASLKREFLPKGSQLMIEDKDGKKLYRSFKSGGMMSDQDYEKGFENEKTHLDSEDFAKISGRVDEDYLAKDRKSGVHDKFTKYWYNGGREKAIAKYGEDERKAWEEAYEDFKEDFYKMAKGGQIDESTAMVLSQNKAIAHHTEELKKALAKNPDVEPWVVGKIERASTDISDVTHYLDGKTEYAKGGYMADGGEVRNYKTFVEEYPDKNIYVRVKFAGSDKDVQKYIANEANKKRAIDFAKRLAEKNNGTYEGFKLYTYAKGGYMADGGRVKGDSLQNVRNDAKTYSRNSKQDVYVLEEKRYEFGNDDDKKIVTEFTMATQEDIDYIKEMPKNRLVVSFKILGKYSNGELKSSEQEVLFSDGGVVKWQDVNVGDNALVIAENKMGYVIKPYGRRFHLKFPDGSEKTYSAEELEFFKDEEYAKGGKTPTSDYTKRRDLKLIVIKNPNKSGAKDYLTIDKKGFLDGLHKMEDGGTLSKDYTYIKRGDVNQVAYYDNNGKLQVDLKPKNGFWVSKKALVEAGMNETKAEPKKSSLDFGTTSLRKTSSGWIAKNKVSNYKGYDWEITTMKSMRGDLVSTAVGGKNEKSSSGYTMFTYVMYQDPNIRLITSKPARITEKVISEQQQKALQEFETKVTDKWYAKGGDIGFEGLAKKVAKNYVGDKVKPKYQKEYGKTYDKEEAKEVGNKVAAKVYRQQLAKMAEGGKLPEDLGKYFTKPKGTKVIPMSNIIPLRARAEGIVNAEKYMKMAYEGKMDKRKPITLYKSQGKYRVYDGNSTYAVAKANGWEYIWAQIIKNPNMNTYEKRGKDIFTRAKEIRKEGEAWKDALQRAKAMK